MSRLFQDFRQGLRACRRSPLVSTLAVLAVGLGVGVTTTVFSIFYGVLMKPLPYPEPDRLDPGLPVTAVQTMEQVVAASVGRQRLVSAMAGVFALLAVVLAAVGVFGVMMYNVRCQRREIGIRLALGADRAAVRALVVRRGLRLALVGTAAGAVGAFLLGGTLQAVLDDVAARDPVVFVATAAAIVAAALLASCLPALTAGRTDPMVVLRDS